MIEALVVLGIVVAAAVLLAVWGVRGSRRDVHGVQTAMEVSDRPLVSLEQEAVPDEIGGRFRLAAPDGPEHDLLGEVVEARESLLFGTDDAGTLGLPVAWNGIAQLVPTIAGALSKGEVVRVIGPQHLIDGIREGALYSTVTSTGAIGAVKGPNGQFVGHLRFESAQEAAIPVSVAGPLLLFQAASVVTMQYYLHQITTRLMDIQEGIDDLKRILSAQTVGKVRSAASMVQDLEGFATRGVSLSADDRKKLQDAETQVREAYETLKDRGADFERSVRASVDDDGAINTKSKEFKKLLGQRSEEGARDAVLLVEAIAVRVRISRLRAFAEIDAAPERHDIVCENLEREFDELRDAFASLREPFDRLNVRHEAIPRSWVRGIDDELEGYRERTKSLRALLRTPVRRVLPQPGPEQPWVVELRQGSSGVESRYAVLEGTAEEA